LLDSIPKPSLENEARLTTIGGIAPSLSNRPHACVFADRCPIAIDKCRTEKPPLETTSDNHVVRCWRWEEVASGAVQPHNRPQPRTKDVAPKQDIVLNVHELRKTFESGSWWQRLTRRTSRVVAVEGASFHVNTQSTLGVVGESGSGKTTLARAIVALAPADSGDIELLNMPISRALNHRNRETLANLRMIFQNPNDALNPYRTVGQAIGRTLELLGKRTEDIPQQIGNLLVSVGLATDYAKRYPTQLSGGEKQRVAIARAFAANPALIIADEPTSALDVSVQAVIVNLLKDLRNQKGVSYVIISHDLELVGYLADWIVVMYLGEIVEQGNTAQVYDFPSHPYTEALISAIPVPDPTRRTGNIRLEGEVPSPTHKPTGCPFHTRCPRFIGNICVEQEPPIQRDDMGHEIRCHYTLAELTALQTAPREGAL
jgi:peptide/nickel transport system ATP-binding protein